MAASPLRLCWLASLGLVSLLACSSTTHQRLAKAVHGPPDTGAAVADAPAPESEPAPAFTEAPAAPAPASATDATEDAPAAQRTGVWNSLDPEPSPAPEVDAPDADEGNPATPAPEQKPESDSKRDDSTPPAFRVTTFEGEVLDSAKLYGTRPVSITFWATWCGPCIMEAPVIEELYAEYGTEVQFVSISIDAKLKAPEVKAFVAKQGWSYPVAFDPSPALARAFKVQSIPLTLLIGADGKVISRLEGFEGKERMLARYRQAFGGESAATDEERDQLV